MFPEQIIVNRGGLRQEKLRFGFRLRELLSRLQQNREQALDLTSPTPRKQSDHRPRLMQSEPRPERDSIILRRHGIEERMADEGTADSRPAIQIRFKRKNDHDMIDTPLNPLDPTRPPGPDLRRNIIEHPVARARGHPREVEIESRVVDQHHEIPRLRLEHRPDRANAPEDGAQGRDPDQPHQIQLGTPGTKATPAARIAAPPTPTSSAVESSAIIAFAKLAP